MRYINGQAKGPATKGILFFKSLILVSSAAPDLDGCLCCEAGALQGAFHAPFWYRGVLYRDWQRDYADKQPHR
ncbi:hypothetical protein VU01_11534 [Candidatus Electrothrix marina]|uniref:Uncharacterized protein n=1 Tax=Candidatus Electrothrix marina TaxID=1859130 RepID=A0A444JE36_9BACT|nr:hypothetical protein VU01_11534 [Candidatus Electrothrix marina]